jgi:hypothetical protein
MMNTGTTRTTRQQSYRVPREIYLDDYTNERGRDPDQSLWRAGAS